MSTVVHVPGVKARIVGFRKASAKKKTNVMNGSNKKMTRSEVLEAPKHPPAGGDYIWDSEFEDDRPATDQELAASLAAARKARGRPPGSTKESTIRIDQDVLEAFRADGAGWQSRMNAALREWLQAKGKTA